MFVGDKVACQQMGFTTGKSVWYPTNNAFTDQISGDPVGFLPAGPSVPVWMHAVYCQGTETRLDQCLFDGWGQVKLRGPWDFIKCDHQWGLGGFGSVGDQTTPTSLGGFGSVGVVCGNQCQSPFECGYWPAA